MLKKRSGQTTREEAKCVEKTAKMQKRIMEPRKELKRIKVNGEASRYWITEEWADNEAWDVEIKISMPGEKWSEFEKQPFYKELCKFLDNEEKGGIEMTPEQKRLEELLMKYLEYQINARGVPMSNKVPETAQALIELWKITEFEQVRS